MHKFMLAVMVVVGLHGASVMAGQKIRDNAGYFVDTDQQTRKPQPTCFERMKSTVSAAWQALRKTKEN